MSMYRFYLTALMAGVLAACGDGDPVVPADEESDPGGEDVGGEVSQAVSTYYPLHFYITGEGYTDESDVFQGVWFSPLIHGYVISPVHAETLAPLENPDISNYVVTVDGEPVSASEQGLMTCTTL